MTRPALQMQGIRKAFPGVQALKDINIEAFSGEALALIGTNGAGKSTLMNILGGILRQDDGQIFIDGEQVSIRNPLDASKKGIAFVQQEMTLMLKMSIADNLFISSYPQKRGLIDYKDTEVRCASALKRLGYGFSPRTLIRDLGAGDRQIVQITRALLTNPRIIIFDEATSSLTSREKDRLFKVIETLKQDRVTIIYITHFLDEVFTVCERAVVLRNGETVGQGIIRELTQEKLVSMMIGQVETIGPHAQSKQQDQKKEHVLMKVSGLGRKDILRNINFTLRAGEIVGLWGLLGSGRTELARSIVGLDPLDEGKIEIVVNGKLEAVRPRDAHQQIGIITEDRRVDGLSLSMSVRENMSAANLKKLVGRIWPFINKRKEKEQCQELVSRLEIKITNINQSVGTLSGGNQQRVVVGRWLQKNPSIYIMDEPTRGLDVAAKLYICQIIGELASKGAGIIVIMSDLDEILSVSHRFLVMKEGEIVAELTSKEGIRHELMAYAAGGESETMI
jgi:ribose transport system ATP-binding protein